MSTNTNSSGARTALIVLGSLLVAGLVGTSVAAATTAATRAPHAGSASEEVTITDAFSGIRITAEVADVVVRYDDVPRAVVEFAEGDARRNMTFEAEVLAGVLAVAVIDHGGTWFAPPGDTWPRVSVTLPASSEPMDVNVETDAGDAKLHGAFGAVEVAGAAGDLDFAGSAESLRAEIASGDIAVRDYVVVGAMELNSSSGNVFAELDALPSAVQLGSHVGDVELVLPPGEFRIETSTNIGDVAVDVLSNPDAELVVRIDTNVDDITVR